MSSLEIALRLNSFGKKQMKKPKNIALVIKLMILRLVVLVVLTQS